MIDLNKLIKETEKLGVVVLWADLPESKGRHLIQGNHKIIFLDKQLDDIEAYNVLLHERSHFINNDYDNVLSSIETYQHRIETVAEKDRIVDFLNLINNEFPIDEEFNYLKYMELSSIDPKYESFVIKTAKSLFLENKENFYD